MKYFYLHLKKIAKKIIYTPYRQYMPVNPRHDDLYIVSYPKSGATWVDFILANINIQMSNLPDVVNFFSIHRYIPDIHDNREINNLTTSFPGFRIIKSHSEFNPEYNYVIYIIRDPRDVMISYYHFCKQLNSYGNTIGCFIRSKKFGIHNWVSHVDKWFNDSLESTRFIYIRYEDLKTDPYKTISYLYDQIGLVIPGEVLENAILRSSFNEMKRMEEGYDYGGRKFSQKFNFMRNGKSGSWVSSLDQDDISYINFHAKKWLIYFKYLQE
jgi:hypothetical protein